LSFNKEVTDCDSIVKGFYAAMLYETSAFKACDADSTSGLVSYMQAMDSAYDKGLCYGIYATHL